LLCAGAVLGLPASASAALTFSPTGGTNLATPQGGQETAIADFDADGDRDLAAVTTAITNQINFFVNDGSGGFSTGTTLATGTGPFSIEAALINADARPDLVVTNINVDTVSVYLATGDFTFAHATGSPLTTETGPADARLTDLDGDDELDMAVVTATDPGLLQVFLGGGDGTFTEAGDPYTVGDQPQSVESGDFDGDQFPDLVTSASFDNELSVLTGDGQGAFTASDPIPASSIPRAVAVGRLDSDSLDDIVAAKWGSDEIQVSLSNGDGTFDSTDYPTGTDPYDVTLADLNGDGALDIVTPDNQSHQLTIYKGATNGSGSFTQDSNSPFVVSGSGSPGFLSAAPKSVAVANLNTDTRLDMVSVNGGSSRLGVFLNTTVTDVVQFQNSFDFGEQDGGTNGTAQSFEFRNDGEYTSTISTVELIGDDAGEFEITSEDCDTLDTGESCFVNVRFSPGATNFGEKEAQLRVVSNDPSSPNLIDLTGESTPNPVLTPSTETLEFGDRRLGTGPTPTLSLTVTNTGTTALNISSASISGGDASHFSIESNGCTSAVAPSGTCQISVGFTPTTISTKAASLDLVSDDEDSPEATGLTGSGVESAVTMSPGDHAFGSHVIGEGGAPSQTYTLQSLGSASLNVSEIDISGANAADFSVSGSTCGPPVAINGSCAFTITFEPSAAGARTATLEVDSDAPTTPSAALSGTGIARAPALELSGALASRRVRPGRRGRAHLEVRNAGNVVISGARVCIEAGRKVKPGPCVTLGPIPPSSSDPVTVVFKLKRSARPGRRYPVVASVTGGGVGDEQRFKVRARGR
jgi:hypothetical protein